MWYQIGRDICSAEKVGHGIAAAVIMVMLSPDSSYQKDTIFTIGIDIQIVVVLIDVVMSVYKVKEIHRYIG